MANIYRVSAALMSNQICKLVYDSVFGFVDFFEQFSTAPTESDVTDADAEPAEEFVHPAFVIDLVMFDSADNSKEPPRFEFNPPVGHISTIIIAGYLKPGSRQSTLG